MKIQATDKTGKTHIGRDIKSLFVCEDSGTPLAVIKETIVGNLINYKILTPGDKEFTMLVKALGFDVDAVRV